MSETNHNLVTKVNSFVGVFQGENPASSPKNPEIPVARYFESILSLLDIHFLETWDFDLF